MPQESDKASSNSSPREDELECLKQRIADLEAKDAYRKHLWEEYKTDYVDQSSGRCFI